MDNIDKIHQLADLWSVVDPDEPGYSEHDNENGKAWAQWAENDNRIKVASLHPNGSRARLRFKLPEDPIVKENPTKNMSDNERIEYANKAIRPIIWVDSDDD